MTATPDPTFTEEFFTSGGVRCAARVYRPVITNTTPLPVVVMAHGFGAVRALRLDAYAERFAAAGYVVVAFDYRGFGDSDGQPRQLLDIKAQHAEACSLALRTRPSGHGRQPCDRVGNVIRWGSRHYARRQRRATSSDRRAGASHQRAGRRWTAWKGSSQTRDWPPTLTRLRWLLALCCASARTRQDGTPAASPVRRSSRLPSTTR